MVKSKRSVRHKHSRYKGQYEFSKHTKELVDPIPGRPDKASQKQVTVLVVIKRPLAIGRLFGGCVIG